jgi:hypothetical protein
MSVASTWPDARARKFHQAAWVYLHLGVLYEAAGWVMWRRDLLPSRFGPPWLYLVLGAVIVTAVFVALDRWRNVWVARLVWLVQLFRFPPLINRAFFVEPSEMRLTPAFYLVALLVVLVSVWALARAAWDL